MKPIDASRRKLPAKLCTSLIVGSLAMTASVVSTSTVDASASASSYVNIVGEPVGPFTNDFNPFSVSNAVYTAGATSMVYEPLMYYNLLKVGHIYPWLASAWSWKDGGKELVLHTRPGVKWSDGQPFTASDVAYTFNLMKRFPALDVNGVTFVSASALSANEAILKFSSPAYTQLFDISQVLIVPEHIWKTVSNPVTYVDTSPVGTGPYLSTSFTSEEITLTRNPAYWQRGLPKIGTVHFLAFASNPSAALASQSGEVDMSFVFMPNWKTEYVDKDPSENHVAVYPIGNIYMCPNVRDYPFNQSVVRQALSEAIDRQAITNEGEHGFYFPMTSPTGLTLPRWETWLAPKYAGLKESFDPRAAKSLLMKDGFREGRDGMLDEPNGKPFRITLLAPAPYTDWMTDGQLMVSEMKQAGIAVTLSGLSLSAWTNDYTVGNYQLTFCGQFTTNDPYSIYNYLLNSNLSAPVGKPATGDIERYQSPAANAALAAAASTDNPAQLRKAYGVLEEIMVKQAPVIPLFDGGDFALYSTRRAVGWPTNKNPYEVNAPASPWDEVIVLHLTPR